MPDSIAEIRSFLLHNDHSLAVRRILDTCLDTADTNLLKQAIAFSRSYRKYAVAQDERLPEEFYESAATLLASIEALNVRSVHGSLQLVSAQHISKTYRSGNFSLHPITLQIFTGDVLGVVGQNGNGKTTLLRCIAGQLALDKGELIFSQLQNPDFYTVKHHIAFIPQRIPRWHGELKDNLRFSAAISGVVGEENELMVDFMLERLNLTAYAHLTWNQISSGYRTRFEIARILLQKPKLLILDEPLANLDINAQQTILTDLRYMAKSVHNPMGVILSSQQLHEVEKIADTVLLIKDGHCLFRTGEQEKTAGTYVLELETTTDRDMILQMLGDDNIQLQYNGGFYTITSMDLSVQEMIGKLVSNNVTVTYLRDITHSTKRFL